MGPSIGHHNRPSMAPPRCWLRSAFWNSKIHSSPRQRKFDPSRSGRLVIPGASVKEKSFRITLRLRRNEQKNSRKSIGLKKMKFPILGWPVFRGYASFRAMSRALASVTYPIQGWLGRRVSFFNSPDVLVP